MPSYTNMSLVLFVVWVASSPPTLTVPISIGVPLLTTLPFIVIRELVVVHIPTPINLVVEQLEGYATGALPTAPWMLLGIIGKLDGIGERSSSGRPANTGRGLAPVVSGMGVRSEVQHDKNRLVDVSSGSSFLGAEIVKRRGTFVVSVIYGRTAVEEANDKPEIIRGRFQNLA
ncbi:hypothetical protein AAE478_009544 [Parahypoxylon ruwenzoriense]